MQEQSQPNTQHLSLEDVERYEKQLKKTNGSASSRAERIKCLMERPSAARWKPKKKQKMVRRLMAAHETCQQSQSLLEQIIVEKENVRSKP